MSAFSPLFYSDGWTMFWSLEMNGLSMKMIFYLLTKNAPRAFWQINFNRNGQMKQRPAKGMINHQNFGKVFWRCSHQGSNDPLCNCHSASILSRSPTTASWISREISDDGRTTASFSSLWLCFSTRDQWINRFCLLAPICLPLWGLWYQN